MSDDAQHTPYATIEALKLYLSTLPDDWFPPKAEARFGPKLWFLAVRESFEFMPQLNEEVVNAALLLVPQEVLPRPGDDEQTLATRIHGINFFDNLMALIGGGQVRGGKRTELNGTCYAQPRRKSWSIVVRDVHVGANGKNVRTMYAYGKANSRIRQDVTAEPMPWPIVDLSLQCFFAVRHVLADVCAASPPNHCQLLAYYGLFDSRIRRHKDDHTNVICTTCC